MAIVIAGGLIAGSIFMSRTSVNKASDGTASENSTANSVEVTPVTDKDHIRGNPDAKLIVVEYSDYQCPFCQQFHSTMQTLMDEYGKNGDVAWVYRQYPIDQIHPLARPAAEVAECVAITAGNDAFWTFSDTLFANTPKSLEVAEMDKALSAQGLDVEKVKACVASGDGKKAVDEDVADGNKIAQANPGNFGTPYSIIVSKDGTRYPFAGALPYASVKKVIDTMLAEQ